jgi:hypothetical protein
MTVIEADRTGSEPSDPVGGAPADIADALLVDGAGPGVPTGNPLDDDDAKPEIALSRLLLAAFLGTAAAAWMVGGAFVGFLPIVITSLAAAAGVAGVGIAVRSGRSWRQYLIAPAAFVLGYAVAVLLPNPTGIKGTVPALVRAAVRNGGLNQPPIPFDPGWRFLAVVLLVLLGAAAASLAAGMRAPRVALLVPLPLVLAGALNQPKGKELLSGTVALVLLVAGLIVTYGAELAASQSGDAGRTFEVRQLLRGGAGLVGVVAVLAVLSQASLLFPAAPNRRQAKPQRPKVLPLEKVKDRPLFQVVSSTTKGPWRLGVLDTYDGSAWLLPPYDPSRAKDLGPGGAVKGVDGPAVEATFTILDQTGFTLPAPANPQRVQGARGDVGYDARLQTFRTRRGAPSKGYSYTVTATRAPGGAELGQSPAPAPSIAAQYLRVPEAPVEVRRLLAAAPANPWERLQFVRAALYDKVVAAGSGVPRDITPARAVRLLGGADGSPFEIVATEALLARWAGIPARIGYGYNGGTAKGGGTELRPRDGANWLEAYFEGHGWVPILGVPPKARSSIDNKTKSTKPAVRPSDRLTLQVYIPLQTPNPLQGFVVLRYWLVRALPLVGLVALLGFLFPWPVKVWRRRQRQTWARERGPAGRIAAAYAEMRDWSVDLAVGVSGSTPLGFLDHVQDDEEHAELAWLVTRCLWGDLARDLTDADAVAAERLSGSVSRRLGRAQPALSLGAAYFSRASLRTPYDPELPNPWPQPRQQPGDRGLRALARRVLRVPRQRRVISA